jgi:hypothetical protein
MQQALSLKQRDEFTTVLIRDDAQPLLDAFKGECDQSIRRVGEMSHGDRCGTALTLRRMALT